MRVAVKMQNNVVVFVREWDDASFIADINVNEVDGPWIELQQSVTVDVGYTYDPVADVFVPPDPEALP
jgi:hypothetical protein